MTRIETPRLIMREFTLDDAQAVFNFSANEEVTRYTGDAGCVNSIADAKSIIINIWLKEYQEHGYARWSLVDKESDRVIGFCGIKYEPELQAPDIGYRMLPEYWGKGLGMEASKAALDYAFAQLGLSHIIGEVDIANNASEKILRNLGFAEQKRYHKWGHDLIKLSIDKFPALNNEQITLIEQSTENLMDVYHLFSNEQVCQYYDLSAMTAQEQALQLIQDDDLKRKKGLGHRWLIRANNSSNIVGSCGYQYDHKERTARISYELHPDYWGQGFASAANALMLDWMFNHINALNRVEAYVMLENNASKKLLSKLGFQSEGVLREKGVWKNKFHDLQLFSLLRADFK